MANAMNNEKSNNINLIDVLSDRGEQKTCLKRCKGSKLRVEDTAKGAHAGVDGWCGQTVSP